jgi:DNA topoisomerase-1
VTRRQAFWTLFAIGRSLKAQRAKAHFNSTLIIDIDETALKFLSLPREIGLHPEADTDCRHFVLWAFHPTTQFRRIWDRRKSFTVGINHAVDMLRQPRLQSSRALRRFWFGGAPDGTGDAGVQRQVWCLSSMAGRATAKGQTPETVTLDEAVALIAEREAKGPGKKPGAESCCQKKLQPRKPLRRKPPQRNAPRRLRSGLISYRFSPFRIRRSSSWADNMIKEKRPSQERATKA